MLRRRPIKKKLASKWVGPYEVQEINGRSAYIVDEHGRKRTDFSQLKKFKQDDERQSTVFFQVPPESESSTEELNPESEQLDSDDEESPDEEPIFWPEKPQVFTRKVVGNIRPVNRPSESYSDTDSDTSDECDSSDTELEKSMDGQLGRGFSHAERQEIVQNTVTRCGRTSKPPERFVANVISQEPVDTSGCRLRGEFQKSAQHDSSYNQEEYATGDSTENINRDSEFIVPSSPRKRNTRENSELEKLRGHTSPPKRIKFYNAQVNTLRSNHKMCDIKIADD